MLTTADAVSNVTSITRGNRKMTSTQAWLKRRSGTLSRSSLAVLTLTERVPERLSLPQISFFLIAATADVADNPFTFSDVHELLGEKGDSVRSTYGIFLAPSRRFPEALAWLAQEIDPSDRRKKYLRLTNEGREIVAEYLKALED